MKLNGREIEILVLRLFLAIRLAFTRAKHLEYNGRSL
jgi:hypothetical protein